MSYDKKLLYGKNLIPDGYFKESISASIYQSTLYKGADNVKPPWKVPDSDKISIRTRYYGPHYHWGIVPDVTGLIDFDLGVAGTSTVSTLYEHADPTISPSYNENTQHIMYLRVSGIVRGPKSSEDPEGSNPVFGGIGVRGYGYLGNSGLTEDDPWFQVANEPSGTLKWTSYSDSALFFIGDLDMSSMNVREALKPFLVMTKGHLQSAFIQEIVLVDLSDVFGEGNEPSRDWCDQNINYQSLYVKEEKKMGRLVWDADTKRLYETGVDHGVLYPKSDAGAYDKGIAWNGLTAVTESPSGAEATALYADNIKYLNLRSAEDFGGTIEAYTYPDEFMACDGSAELAPGIVVGQQARKPFGLSYRTILGNDAEGNDHGYKLHLVYGADASPSERGYQTVNDSPDAITFSWEFSTTPVAVTGFKPCACLTIDSTKVDADKLAKLEDILYGTDGDESSATVARLPLPDEVLQILSAAG